MQMRERPDIRSEAEPNIASPSNMAGNNYMKIEGAGEISHSADMQKEHDFDNIKYDIGRNTKEMVNKIFKAASSNNQ